MQNQGIPPPSSFGAPQPPAKKGLSKGCIIGIIAAVVVAVGGVILIAAGLGGYFLYRSSETENVGTKTSVGVGPVKTSTKTSGAPAAEGPNPTDAQRAAVSGGQTAEWTQQEISWTVPQRWSRYSEDSTSLLWRSPGSWDAASLIVSISPMDASFPVEASINAFYEQAQTRKTNGEVNEVRWLMLDGIKGVLFRESSPESDDNPQRLQWMAYRNYKGQVQLVNIMLASRGKDFARHEDVLYGILYSTEFME
ncbi:MAG TPA: hypothetical protein VF240_10180 [Pyrinomonadaceae bacterium]